MPARFARKAGEALRAGRPIEERLKDFTSLVGRFVPGAHASVFLFDRASEDFYLRATTLRLPTNQLEFQFGARGTLPALSVRERRPVMLTEINRAAGASGRAEVLLLPLVYIDEPIGVLAVESTADSGLLKDRAEALAEAAACLGDAVGASLREETNSLRMTKIAAINEAGVNIISTLDLARLLKLVATTAGLIMEAESCVIRLFEPQNGKYAIREFHGLKPEAGQKALFRMDTRAVTRILKGEPFVLVRDVRDEPGWAEFSAVARTMICLPLRHGNEVIGTISVFDKVPAKTFHPSSFGIEDQATFEKFVRYCEKAVANAMTFERNEKLKNLDELTGLPTLKYFHDRLIHEISRAKRFGRRLVLMTCEVSPRIDGDEGAAGRGDAVVKRLSNVMRQSLREYDVISRIGDRKFAMILPEAVDGKASAIPRIKKSIFAEVEEIRRKDAGVSVDVRFGHASFPEDGDDQEKLVFKSSLLKM